LPDDPIGELFDTQTGKCVNAKGVIDRLHIPLDEPRIAMLRPETRRVHSQVYEGDVMIPVSVEKVFDVSALNEFYLRKNTRFEEGRVGFGGTLAVNQDSVGYDGYDAKYDLNNDGVIDDLDLERAKLCLGRTVRHNYYLGGYFGSDWVSGGAGLLAPEHTPGIPVIVDYEYGAGYDSSAGIARLFETPGPNKPVWIEYHYDAPADAGSDNIIVHCYRETA
jgi:hypothetical protein